MLHSVGVSWRVNDAGPVVLAARDVHRVSVHASSATASVCRASSYRCVRRHGDVDITPAGATGGFDADTPSRTLELELSPSFVARVADELGQPHARRTLTPRHVVSDARISGLAWALEEEHRAVVPAGRLYVDSLANALAVHLLGLHSVLEGQPMGLDAQRLRRVLDYIEANLDQRLTLAQLARVAGVSSAHLRTWFKARTGLPVHRHVVRRRVERARVLLLQGLLPASEIALAAGFAHQTHMARWLRRELGVTPRELNPRS
ncbi:AraC family transcriptional regulator [Corallococcus carmarthensis]|uniref:AraC family transcriptional regulator n=1 Tax=Corallococcus carmarthensis TaxID=2316728 RepID=UPI00148D751F|nr:AraC family transcriptional regulator [Corallococcus carmarthensis]NOK17006.1 helix-turn-helix transcriptional regulator [Corallococcus carmarthensis]